MNNDKKAHTKGNEAELNSAYVSRGKEFKDFRCMLGTL